MTNDDAIDEPLIEFDFIHWDSITINEIRKAINNDLCTTKRGTHLFARSGHDQYTHGIVFMHDETTGMTSLSK